jgi:excisionase family DNA binding protein
MSATLLAVALDRHAAAHLLAALRAHRRFARTQGYEIPAALDQLERSALTAIGTSDADRSRQTPTLVRQPSAEQATVGPMTCTIREAAAAIGVSTRSIERLVRAGEIDSKMVGGSRRIPLRELERLGGAATASEAKET